MIYPHHDENRQGETRRFLEDFSNRAEGVAEFEASERFFGVQYIIRHRAVFIVCYHPVSPLAHSRKEAPHAAGRYCIKCCWPLFQHYAVSDGREALRETDIMHHAGTPDIERLGIGEGAFVHITVVRVELGVSPAVFQ